jgi:hypothetical protein
MICEQIGTCQFIACVSKVMPVTAEMIKSTYCKKEDYVCAKYQDHEVIAIDKERGNLCPDSVIGELDIFEKKYTESYKKLCVRRHRETIHIHKS